jgi:hypothetical protein
MLAVLAMPSTMLDAQRGGRGAAPQKPPCAPSLAACPDQGCGVQFDANLNLLKNIRSDNQTATTRTLAWITKLDNPEHFSEGDTREELTQLGEGQKIMIAAYIIAAKAELGGESCNCGLHTAAETDNHLVLVSKPTIDKFHATSSATTTAAFHSRELQSVTAEFTPRVRLQHPNFTREVVQPLIDHALNKALLVRVTGLLMFDSEHFIKNPLTRRTNWEIHPVLKFEVCTTGATCKPASDAGWKSVDDL